MKRLTAIFLLLTLFAFELADLRSIYHIPMQADAVTASDLNLDGDLDLIIKHSINSQTGWGGIYMMKNDGYGHFEFLNTEFDTAIAWTIYADTILSKTWPDLVYHSSDSIVILTNDGANYSKFRFYVGPKVNDFDLGDVDGNGHLDVVFISNNNRYWGIIYNLGDSSFTAPEYYNWDTAPTDIACDDLNADNREDIVITGASSKIYYSTETGFEMQLLQQGASHVKIADMDNDGDNDIILVGDAYIMSFVNIFENLGNNTFVAINDFNISNGCPDFLITDFNNDSLPDALFMTYDSLQDYMLYYNMGGFQMGNVKVINLTYYGETRRFMHCADMDGNGFTDIITTRQVFDTTYAPSLLEILFNDGHGNFGEDPLTSIQTTNIEHETLNLVCYPNPFSDRVNIEFRLSKDCIAELGIYNSQGQKIKTLTNKELTKGKYNHAWNGIDNNGKEVSSGVYIIRLVAGIHTQSCRLMYNK